MYSSVFLAGNIFERILLLSYLCSAKQNNQNYMIMYSTHYRYYLTVATVAFVVFLCIRVISYLPYIHTALAESICFWELAWICCFKAKKENIPLRGVVLAILIGRLFLELPERTAYFRDSLISLPSPVICIVCILLGTFCTLKPKFWVYFLSLVIIYIMNVFIYDAWRDYILTLKTI